MARPELLVISGRPGVGKSTVELNLRRAWYAAHPTSTHWAAVNFVSDGTCFMGRCATERGRPRLLRLPGCERGMEWREPPEAGRYVVTWPRGFGNETLRIFAAGCDAKEFHVLPPPESTWLARRVRRAGHDVVRLPGGVQAPVLERPFEFIGPQPSVYGALLRRLGLPCDAPMLTLEQLAEKFKEELTCSR